MGNEWLSYNIINNGLSVTFIYNQSLFTTTKYTTQWLQKSYLLKRIWLYTNLLPPNWKLKNLSNINAFFGDLYMEEFLRTQTQLSKHMLITLLCGLYFEEYQKDLKYRLHHRLSKFVIPEFKANFLAWFFLSRIYWSLLDHDLMDSI